MNGSSPPGESGSVTIGTLHAPPAQMIGPGPLGPLGPGTTGVLHVPPAHTGGPPPPPPGFETGPGAGGWQPPTQMKRPHGSTATTARPCT